MAEYFQKFRDEVIGRNGPVDVGTGVQTRNRPDPA